MFTKNKIKLDGVQCQYASHTTSTLATRLSGVQIKNTSGSTVTFTQEGSATQAYGVCYYTGLDTGINAQTATISKMFVCTSAQGYADLVVGSGTTTPTEDDYCIENQITTLEAISTVKTISSSTGIARITKTMRNTSESNITVSEVGIISRFNTKISSNTLSLSVIPVLMARYVLDNPLTVAPQQMFTVDAEIL